MEEEPGVPTANQERDPTQLHISRRHFLKGMGASTAAAVMASAVVPPLAADTASPAGQGVVETGTSTGRSAAVKVDLRIVGGTIVDPERGVNGPGEVLIRGNRIVGKVSGEAVEAERTIHADGCLVFPGLIDFHVHLFGRGTESGVDADISLPPMGVTTGVDPGSCGSANFDQFMRTTVATSRTRIFAFINISPAGLIATRYAEQLDPKYYDEATITDLFAQYRGQLLGIKVRVQKDIVGNFGIRPLQSTLEIAQRLHCPVVVHTTNPVVSPDKIAAILRPGDVYCHVHQGVGDTIIGADGKVRTELYAAQKAGLIFDASNGRANFSVKVAQAALAQGFRPDVISSDLTKATLYGDYVYSLPFIMMKYLNLGMALDQVVAACTSVPARLIGMKGQLGTLAPGALADVAVFRLGKKRLEVKDVLGDTIVGDHMLIPQMTVLNGRIVYRQMDFQ
jgi:predicted amidohydrolase